MAKPDSVGFPEQHLEKVVLGLCLVLLGLALWRWIAGSPNRWGRQNLPPEKVDQTLVSEAQKARSAYRQARAVVEPVPRHTGRTRDLRQIGPTGSEAVDLALPGLPLKTGLALEGGVTLAELGAKVPVPPRPTVVLYSALPNRPPLDDRLVVHGVSVYPIEQLTKDWEALLKGKVPHRVVVAKTMVEVQQALPDGSWGSPTAIVPTAVPPRDPKDPRGGLAVAPLLPDYDGKNGDIVRQIRNILADPLWQDYALRPEYYPVWAAAAKGWGDWRVQKPPVEAPEGYAAVWFHDDGTAKIGGTYRYRVQLVLVNPLLSYDSAARSNPADASQKFIQSKPSEWSNPVSMGRQVHFFLTGASRTTGQMTVEVHARKLGQPVAKSFRAVLGEPIGGKADMAIIDPEKPGARRSVSVDFSTGCIAVRFNFDKQIIKRGSGMFTPTAEMIYLGPDGRLHSRIQARDEVSELRRRLQQELQEAQGP